MTEYRVEHDSMGEVRVPVDALWGAQTQRAVENFPISGRPVDGRVIRALALIKSEAAEVNAGLREVPNVDRRVANAIAAVADEVAGGRLPRRVPDRHVPDRLGHLDEHEHERGARVPRVGTRLGEAGSVHPNDHVNASQSSNDVFPSAVHLAAARPSPTSSFRRPRSSPARCARSSGSSRTS